MDSDNSMPVANLWKPTWIVDVGQECVVGLTMDDGCYVTLIQSGDTWKPTTHVPREVARVLKTLVD